MDGTGRLDELTFPGAQRVRGERTDPARIGYSFAISTRCRRAPAHSGGEQEGEDLAEWLHRD